MAIIAVINYHCVVDERKDPFNNRIFRVIKVRDLRVCSNNANRNKDRCLHCLPEIPLSMPLRTRHPVEMTPCNTFIYELLYSRFPDFNYSPKPHLPPRPEYKLGFY